MVYVIPIVIGVGIVALIAYAGSTCDGKCAPVDCTESAPCKIGTQIYTVGAACAPGVEGSVCEKHRWPFADCTCHTTIGPGNVPQPKCFK